ncbi:hypothetical protein DYH09_33880 [bacterium CPR1]|nr:hypothetical protein [bacterium CPR1]
MAIDRELRRCYAPCTVLGVERFLLEPEALWLLAALSCHRSGYVRAAALGHLAELDGDAWALPFAFIRLNDWVPAVRARAVALVEQHLIPERTARWLECLPLVLRLESWTRADHSAIRQRILGTLSEELLWQALESPDRQLRRALYPALLERGSRQEVLSRALADSDLVVRLWACRQEPHSDQLLEQMLASTSAAVRTRGLLQWGRSHPVPEWARFDPGPGVRQAARSLEPSLDYRGLYRQAIAEGRHLEVSLAALVSCGRRQDAELGRALLDHPRPRVRRRALELIAAQDLDNSLELLLDRGAYRALIRAAGRLDPADLFARLTPQNAAPLLALLRQGSKWTGLGYLLQAAPRFPDEVERELQVWLKHYNLRQIPPSREELAFCRAALGPGRPDLESLLEGWSRSLRPL